MGTFIEDLYDHEGYGARQLPDGTLTATWSAATAAFDAYIAACGCGWHGGEHPPTDDGYEAAVGEWQDEHARPLLATTVPAEVREAVADAKQVISELSRTRPDATRRVLDDLEAWTAAIGGRLGGAVPAERMRSQLEGLGRRDPGSMRRR